MIQIQCRLRTLGSNLSKNVWVVCCVPQYKASIALCMSDCKINTNPQKTIEHVFMFTFSDLSLSYILVWYVQYFFLLVFYPLGTWENVGVCVFHFDLLCIFIYIEDKS